MVAAGLSPREALEAATLAPARLLGWDSMMGSVAAGKIADLILAWRATRCRTSATRAGIAGVFAQGRYYSRKDLDGMIAAQVASVVH